MRRDHLLLITTSYPERGDGSEAAGAFVADLAEELARHVPVRVVAPGAGAALEETRNGISIRRFASPRRALSLLSPTRPSDWMAIASTLRSLRTQTLAAGADERIAHTLALWALPSGWAAATLTREQGVPYSVWVLGSDIWTLGHVLGVRSVLRNVIRGATCRFADGIKLGSDAADISGLSFEFLPSTRHLEGARTMPLAAGPPYRLLFLGRWHTNKGVDLLLDALQLLEPADWARIAEVRIAGGGPLESLVHARVMEFLASGHPVCLDGYLDREAATAALNEADWLLLPSRIESIPVVFSDAMRMGLPVVAMPVGDLPALMSKHSLGFLAANVDAESFAFAIRNALSSSPLHYQNDIADCAKEFRFEPVALLSQLGFTNDWS